MKYLRELFSEKSDISSMRIGTIGILVLFTPVLICVWCYVSLSQHIIAELPESILGLYVILLTGKAVQKFAEKKQG